MSAQSRYLDVIICAIWINAAITGGKSVWDYNQHEAVRAFAVLVAVIAAYLALRPTPRDEAS